MVNSTPRRLSTSSSSSDCSFSSCRSHQASANDAGNVSDQSIDILTSSTNTLDVSSDEGGDITINRIHSEKMRGHFLNFCRRGMIDGLKEWLREDPDFAMFFRAMDREGNTGLLLAARCEKGLDTVKWLHSQGTDIKVANHAGRTPLMEAALWGRFPTVQHLAGSLEVADIEARDKAGRKAVYFAFPTLVNKAERARRAEFLEEIEVEKEDRERGKIVAHLQWLTMPKATIKSSAITELHPRVNFKRLPNGTLELWRREVSFPLLQSANKAFGVLQRKPKLPLLFAMSGHSHPDHPNVLNNVELTNKSMKLCQLLDLQYDTQAASHVEPQLIAYLFYRYSVFGKDGEWDGVKLFYDFRPIITVSKTKMCNTCTKFVRLFETKFPGFAITFNFTQRSLK